jgi:hypothetical protein
MPALEGESKSRRTARPYVLALVGLAVLLALIVAVAKPRTSAERAAPDFLGEPVTPNSSKAPSDHTPGEGTREMPGAYRPLDSTAAPPGDASGKAPPVNRD